jgi:hypothetical protein
MSSENTGFGPLGSPVGLTPTNHAVELPGRWTHRFIFALMVYRFDTLSAAGEEPSPRISGAKLRTVRMAWTMQPI